MLDARRDDLHSFGIRVIEVDELLALFISGREHEVGAAHDIGLDPGAHRRIISDADLGLDSVERVKRRDERTVEDVLQSVSDRAREPVVRVQRVIAVALALEMVEHAVDERVDELWQQLLRHRRSRPRRHVHDPKALFHLQYRWLLGVLAPGEHVASDSGTRQRQCQRANIDVHTTAVAGARLRQRRGVHAEHGNAAHRHRPRSLPVPVRTAPRSCDVQPVSALPVSLSACSFKND